ncbi:MAG: T9SS type A sorting domain-containing protein, partial [Chitinophagales bacterium]
SSGTTTFCSGSGVYLTTIGGYSYQWQKTGTNISGATNQNYSPSVGANYKVIITDNHGCSKTSAALSVIINTSPTPVISGPANVCVGSSVALSCGSFVSYIWSTGSNASTINVNTAGSYSVTVTDVNGCSGNSPQKTVALSELPVPVITASGATQFCDGGSVTLDAGSGYSSYNWSNSKTTQTNVVKVSGTYVVTVTNAGGCAGTSDAINVTAWIIPSVNVTAVGPINYCLNAGTYLTTLSGPYNYQWLKGTTNVSGATNQSFAPVSSGTYKVKVTDVNGCNKTSSGLKVTVNPLPASTISISGSNSICSGQTKTISANTGSGLTYLWKREGDVLAGATASTYVAPLAGNYTCVVTNSSGCAVTSNTITIIINCKGDAPNGMEGDKVSWLIYPNPTNHELHIRMNTGEVESGDCLTEIKNLMGATIWFNKSTFMDHSIETDLNLESGIPTGMYFVVIHVGDMIYRAPFVVSGK